MGFLPLGVIFTARRCVFIATSTPAFQQVIRLNAGKRKTAGSRTNNLVSFYCSKKAMQKGLWRKTYLRLCPESLCRSSAQSGQSRWTASSRTCGVQRSVRLITTTGNDRNCLQHCCITARRSCSLARGCGMACGGSPAHLTSLTIVTVCRGVLGYMLATGGGAGPLVHPIVAIL